MEHMHHATVGGLLETRCGAQAVAACCYCTYMVVVMMHAIGAYADVLHEMALTCFHVAVIDGALQICRASFGSATWVKL